MSDRRLLAAFVTVVVLVSAFLPPRLDEAHAETAGVLYVLDPTCCTGAKGGVVRIDPSTDRQTVISSGKNFQNPVGIALAANGIIYVVDATADPGHGIVFKIDPTIGNVPPGHNQADVSMDGFLTAPNGIALGADGSIYVTNGGCGCSAVPRVIRINPTTGQQTVVAENGLLVAPAGIAIGPNGLIYVTDPQYVDGSGIGAVIRVNPALALASNQTLIASSNGVFSRPVGLAFGPDGMLYVVDQFCCASGTFGFGGVIKVNSNNTSDPANNHTLVSDNSFDDTYGAPFGIAYAPNGLLYIADATCCGDPFFFGSNHPGGVLEMDPADGSVLPRFTGGEFSNPNGGPYGAIAVPEMSIADASPVAEGGTASFTITLTPASAQTIAIPFMTANGSATAGSDYNGTLGTVIFNPGETTKTLTVTTLTDTLAEPIETFQLTLQPPNGVGATRVTAVGTIQDPGTAPALSIADASAVEGNAGTSPLTLTVTLAPASAQVIIVQFATSDGTATAGQDYVATSGVLTFQAGETTKQIPVPIVGETTPESNETFAVTLANPAGGATLGRAVATVTIQDDDGPASLSVDDVVVAEGNAGPVTATFSVVLSRPLTAVVTVQFATANGTATASRDYQPSNGTLTFQPGETGKSVPVTVIGDTTHEPNETYTFTLSNPTGAVLGRAVATGLITDDDPQPPPAPTTACSPRPAVVATPAASGGKLNVHVQATPLNTLEHNTLTEVRFGQLQNAKVTLNGQTIASGQTYTVPANSVGVDFTVERVAAGQATTVPFVVVDGCGQWPTFVGGGAAAGF